MQLPDILFNIAGIALGAHVVLSFVTVRGLADYPIVAAAVFTAPNRLLGTPAWMPQWMQLMRVRYFWPFRALPVGTASIEAGMRRLLLATRLAGFCFACSLLGFFVSLLIEAGS
jgi:hypothetical protein